jgi:Caspase domain
MKPRDLLICCFFLATGVVFATAAQADRRVALVIGNSAYKSASTLANTINDSTAIATLFKSAGFEVVLSRNDLGVVDFKRAVREFLLTAENADIAVVYYAGHGIEVGGTNYLIPVDAKLGREYDVEDEAVSLDRIIWALQSVRRLRLILLDACRDNPFPTKLRSAGMRAVVQGGLAKIQDVSADTLVAYAAKAGSTSYDGDGGNSPYATALVKHLTEPGLDVRIALGRVRDEVINMTGGRQEPFIYGSLGGATIPLVPAPAPKMIEQAVVKDSVPVVREPTTAVRPPPSVLPPQINPASNPPSPVPPVLARTEPAKTPQPKTSAEPEPLDPTLACSRDEQRLARLRSNPIPEEIVSFKRDLSCARLSAQVQRLFESVTVEPRPPIAPVTPASKPAAQQAQIEPAPAEDPCSRDAARLARLRADPSADAIAKFDRELGCERIRPQLRRLRESLGL